MSLDRAALKDYADDHFTTNGNGEIEGAELNSFSNDIADSAIIKNEAGDLGAGLEWSAGLIRIADAGVTLAKMENRNQGTFIGRKAAAGTGAPQEMSGSEAKTILAIAAGDVSGLAAIATSGSASDLSTGTLPIARIADGDVTLAKLANLSQATIIGRASGAGTGVPTALSAGQVSTILGLAAIATSGSGADLANATVSYAKIANGTGLSVIGRSANSAGVNADIVGTDGQVLRVSGTALGFGTIATAGIADAAVSYAKIANGTGLSVIGRSANSAGVNADMTGTADQVLRVNTAGTALGFGTIATAGIADAAVTLAKMANLSASTIIGRASGAGTGIPTALTASQVKTILAIAASDVSGLAAIATSGSASDLASGTVPDARISGSYTGFSAITASGNMTLSTAPGIFVQSSNVIALRFTTSDGSDTGLVQIGGGGAIANTRGAFLRLYGNENATTPGQLDLVCGAGAIVNVVAPETDFSGDVIINGSTGLAVGNILGTTFNFSSTGQVGDLIVTTAGGAGISGVRSGSKTFDFASVADGAVSATTTVTVTGAAVGDFCLCSISTLTTQKAMVHGNVSAANTVTVWLENHNGAALDLASGTLRVLVFKV